MLWLAIVITSASPLTPADTTRASDHEGHLLSLETGKGYFVFLLNRTIRARMQDTY